MTRLRRWVPWAAAGLPASLAVAFAGCSAANENPFPEDNGGTTSASSAGGIMGGGPGGAGMSEGGGDEAPSACNTDCSTIETPACLTSICNEQTGQCEVVPSEAGTSCDDGVFCTVEDSCRDGECVGGPPNSCGLAAGECDEVVCNEAARDCQLVAIPNGGECTPADLCEVGGTCVGGVCTGVQNDCFFAVVPNECHVAVCNPANGICEPQIGNEGDGCVDSNDLCTVGKTCAQGACVGGAAMDCSHMTQGCFNGECNLMSGQCQPVPVPQGGSCNEAADDCNTGQCDANGLCQPIAANENGACEDGNPCTAQEYCTSGVCGNGVAVPQTTYFSESFADNSAGWTMDTEWAIGPAVSSAATMFCGSGDPGTDTSDNMADPNNGVAGVVIGGNALTNTHAFYYLTSPTFDTSAAIGGPLWFGFERWLNSDYSPFMDNTVEVWDGTQWVLLWSSDINQISDMTWQSQLYDVGAYANSQMQVRFGFNIGQIGVYECSSWNVDDVRFANVICSP